MTMSSLGFESLSSKLLRKAPSAWAAAIRLLKPRLPVSSLRKILSSKGSPDIRRPVGLPLQSSNPTGISCDMIDINHLLKVADAYALACNIEEKTVSNRVFQDGKKLAAVRGGKEITVGRFNTAIEWFSANWPDGVLWPDEVERPDVEMADAAARRIPPVTDMENQDHLVPVALDQIASKMAAEFGFKPSRMQVVQFMARKSGFSVG